MNSISISHSSHHEPIRLGVYIAIFTSLLFLTGITVAASYVDFGTWNTVVALLIATIKASLVALFFMHLWYDHKIHLVLLIASLFFVAVLFIPILVDIKTRGIIDPIWNLPPTQIK